MAETDDQGTRTRDNSQAPSSSGQQNRKNRQRRKSGKHSPDQRRDARTDRTAPLHQTRILAMQALYEDDLTHHGLDDILQHIGEQVRKEHSDYYARVRSDTKRAVEEIGFLARNTEIDATGASATMFDDATDKIMDGMFMVSESAESGFTDEYFARVRTQLEQTVKSALVDFRTSAQRYVHSLAGNQAEDDEQGEANLARMERETAHRVDTALVRDERLSRDTFLEIMRHTERIARGVETNSSSIDPVIERAAPAFPIPQLASIDRAVLRVAVYELLYEPDVPFKAAINEAVEIAKHFGGPNSGKFTNGVLRTIAEGLPDSRKEPKPRSA